MRTEIPRQLVHLSGLFFVMLSIYIGKQLTAALFLGIAAFFLIYSLYVSMKRSASRSILSRIDHGFQRLFMRFERKTGRPFMGPFWFYLSLFLVFSLFPIDAAFLAGLVLSVGDSLATLVGKALGKHMLMEGKSLEGSLAFLVGSIFACLVFSSLELALLASLAGLLGELLPGLPSLRGLAERGILNDNLTITLFSGIVVWAFMAL